MLPGDWRRFLPRGRHPLSHDWRSLLRLDWRPLLLDWRRSARVVIFLLVPIFVAGLLVGHLTLGATGAADAANQAADDTYRLSSGFSGVQGRNQWYYLQWDGSQYSQMAWEASTGQWHGKHLNSRIGPGWARPDTDQVVIGWQAPRSGIVTVQGTMDHRMYTPTSDGVRAVVKQRRGTTITKVWPSADYQVIRPNFMAQHVFKVDVRAGDMLYFHVDQFGTAAYDTLFWDLGVTYGLEPKFLLDQAESVMTPDAFQKMRVPTAHDSSLSVVPNGKDFDFYHSFGTTNNGTMLAKFSGTLADPAQKSVYSMNMLNTRDGEQWWIANMYRTPDNALLAFCHIENADPARYGWWGIGLAFSTDNGASFRRLGWVVGQHVADSTGQTNIGGVPYVAKDGYFYLYYGDVMTVGTAPDPSVARAPIAEVLDAARRGTVSDWRKYHNGEWTEPGLNGRATPIMDHGLLYSTHGDSAFSTYLGKYLFTGYTHGPGKGVFLTFSKDAVSYETPSWIQRSAIPDKDSLSPYETIVNMDGLDNGIVGQSFYIYYGYQFRQADVVTGDYPRLYRWLYRQKVTLNVAGFSGG
ncbi:hypothetical protein Drose_00620 [Dactylosporangium roseum]|uniref:Uncharacterized protein n=1 Tax=Dactylosporangium roseum TaxID=47989 RepID=A0ABY5Z4A9_9ACTN|nr:DUF4185 domain-containing protein [Dactylosporangium roseum]UWZ36880.1 hypothetical protein Drose_00620 [Dactylosporangium roseum]